MEAGWYELAHDQFNKALEKDEGFYMAYVGKVLSNEDFGFQQTDDEIGSYKEKLNEISQKDDLDGKLTMQQKRILKALTALHNEEKFSDGLRAMAGVLQDVKTDDKSSYVDDVIGGNVLLLRADNVRVLQSRSSDNVYALQYLTHNLNPYKNGKKRQSDDLRGTAIYAIYTYLELEVRGAAQITADSVDISEYYAQWRLGIARIRSMNSFVFGQTSDNGLFRIEGDNYMVNGLDVFYMSVSFYEISVNEKLHFFYLQVSYVVRSQPVIHVYHVYTKVR